MNITNSKNFPQALVTACELDTYDRGRSDITVTQLIGPPQIRRLLEIHEDEVTRDVSEMIWALQGKSKHYILELAGKGDPKVITERRFYCEFKLPNITGMVTLGGQIDILDADGILWDYKETSVWTYVYKSREVEWTEQLNCLKYLLNTCGIEVSGLKILGLWRDWSKNKVSKTDDSYPQEPVTAIDVPMWSHEEAERYIQARLALHYATDTVPCTDEERWLSRPQYAVIKTGAKRAMRLFDEYSEAKDFMAKQMTRGLRIELRGEENDYKRCKGYCDASAFCPQWNGGKA